MGENSMKPQNFDMSDSVKRIFAQIGQTYRTPEVHKKPIHATASLGDAKPTNSAA